tara:strand:- start:571 stop:714 length:144 start_codon:yes stop_codon:yes gene_type:complete
MPVARDWPETSVQTVVNTGQGVLKSAMDNVEITTIVQRGKSIENSAF